MPTLRRVTSIRMSLLIPACLTKYFVGFKATIFKIVAMLWITRFKAIKAHE